MLNASPSSLLRLPAAHVPPRANTLASFRTRVLERLDEENLPQPWASLATCALVGSSLFLVGATSMAADAALWFTDRRRALPRWKGAVD